MGRKPNDGRGRLGGRKPGVPNDITKNITKAFFQKITEKALRPDPNHPDGLSEFEQHLECLTDNEWVNHMLKMAEFHTPRMKAVDMSVDTSDSSLTIDAKLRILSGEDDLDE